MKQNFEVGNHEDVYQRTRTVLGGGRTRGKKLCQQEPNQKEKKRHNTGGEKEEKEGIKDRANGAWRKEPKYCTSLPREGKESVINREAEKPGKEKIMRDQKARRPAKGSAGRKKSFSSGNRGMEPSVPKGTKNEKKKADISHKKVGGKKKGKSLRKTHGAKNRKTEKEEIQNSGVNT